MELKVLMLAGLAGDARAHQQLLVAAAARLRSYYARRLGGDAPDLEDLVQETLIAIHERRESYNSALPFTAWLHAIAKYKLIDHYRRAGVRRHVELDDIGELAAEDGFESALAAIDIERMLGQLPPKHRQAIKLTRIDGYSVEEASRKSGQSASAIKIGVHRGLKKLTAKVRDNDDDDRN
jgi:RNA polymerase sigma-70 factor (ECF subfamily)